MEILEIFLIILIFILIILVLLVHKKLIKKYFKEKEPVIKMSFVPTYWVYYYYRVFTKPETFFKKELIRAGYIAFLIRTLTLIIIAVLLAYLHIKYSTF